MNRVIVQVTKKMKKIIVIAVASAALGGCSSGYGVWPSEVITTPSPADDNAGIRRQKSTNFIGEFYPRKPTDPSEWRRLNKEQTSTLGGG